MRHGGRRRSTRPSAVGEFKPDMAGVRSCLHCVVARVMEAEGAELPIRASGCPGPLWLPVSGVRLYRDLEQLLALASAEGDRPVVRLVVSAQTSHVDVTAVVPGARDSRAVTCRLPRHAAGSLEGGFTEGIVS